MALAIREQHIFQVWGFMPLQEVWLKAKPSYPAKPAAIDTRLSSLHITSYSLPQCPKLDFEVHSETEVP